MWISFIKILLMGIITINRIKSFFKQCIYAIMIYFKKKLIFIKPCITLETSTKLIGALS